MSDLDRQAALITRAATYLDQWAAEWAQRWPDDKLTPLGMGDLAVELRGLLPESDPTIEVASTRSAGWVTADRPTPGRHPVSAPTIDPAVLTDTVAAHRMAELVDLYFQHNPTGRYQTDAADGLQALAAAVRQRALDPGLHLAWPEDDQEPVADVDYLPADDDRGYIEPTVTGGAHDGYTFTDTVDDALAECAAVRAAGAAIDDEWIGWPNSRRAGVAA